MNATKWNLKETVVAIVLGAAFGFIYLGWVQVWLWSNALFGPLAMDIVFGVWFMGSTVGAALIRKPGAALGVSMAAVLTELLAGSPSGAIMLLTGLVQGAGSEVPYLLSRYRKFGPLVSVLSGACASLFSFAYTWIRFGYGDLAPGLVATMFAVRVTSGALLGGLLGWMVVKALEKTGVPRSIGLGGD
jgi:energy-coupling factor transport system substrate-specific component